jgi:hypothetical protein
MAKIAAKLTPEQAGFRRSFGPDQRRCGGYTPLRPCSMFLPHGTMLQGGCDAVNVETDDEHTCQLWEERTLQDDIKGDESGYPDGDADDTARSLSARMGRNNLMGR